MKSFDLNLLRTLDAVLSAGSVTAAAERMHLSVPAMSHALARLRDLVGDPLLVRAGRGLVPTPRALELKEPVARLLAEADSLVEVGAAKPLDTVQRSFVVRAPDGMVVVFGATMSDALRQAMPRSTLHFLSEANSDPRALREGRIDVDIGTLATRDPELEVVELSRQGLIGVVSPSHPMASSRWTLKRFVSQVHVSVAPRLHDVSPIDTALGELGQTRFIALTVPTAYAALIVSMRSMLVATVPERMRGMALAQGLRVFELPFDVVAVPLVMAWHPRQSADPAHRWLREQIQFGLADPYWTPPPPFDVRDLRRPAA